MVLQLEAGPLSFVQIPGTCRLNLRFSAHCVPDGVVLKGSAHMRPRTGRSLSLYHSQTMTGFESLRSGNNVASV
jgi:hypothetical protein